MRDCTLDKLHEHTFITNIQISQQDIQDIVPTTKCRAFTAAEMDKIVAKVHAE